MSITNLKSTCLAFAHGSMLARVTVASLSLALSITTLPILSPATTLYYKSFNDLMKEAEAVVSGRVVSVNSQYNANKEVYTFVTLDGVEVLSGAYPDSSLTVRLKGGKIEHDISHVIGSPEFEEGEKVILFLNGNGKNMVPFVGWTQGVFRVQQDPATSLDVVKDAEGNRVVGVQNGQVLRDQAVQPEATILKQNSGAGEAQSQYQGNAGTSDSRQAGSAALAGQAQSSALKSTPTLSAAGFRELVRSSAALRQSKGEISSVRVLDFSVPNANADASLEGKPSPSAATQGEAPVPPKGNDLAPVKDRQ
jgi:hypothetical protein